METVAYIIYICLCSFIGVVCVKADMDINDWKYWAILGSIVGAYICGVCQ